MAFQPPPNKNKTHGFPATTLHKQNKWLSSHHTKKTGQYGSPAIKHEKKSQLPFSHSFFSFQLEEFHACLEAFGFPASYMSTKYSL